MGCEENTYDFCIETGTDLKIAFTHLNAAVPAAIVGDDYEIGIMAKGAVVPDLDFSSDAVTALGSSVTIDFIKGDVVIYITKADIAASLSVGSFIYSVRHISGTSNLIKFSGEITINQGPLS